MDITVYLENEQDKVAPPEDIEQLVKLCTAEALREEGLGDDDAEVSVTLTDNENIRAINNEHRGIDSATDVLSFPMFDEEGSLETNPETDAIVLGDIVISLERAAEQAKEYGHSFRREVAFLITHSLFHLLGYDHVNSEEEEKEMFGKQDKVLDALGITRGA